MRIISYVKAALKCGIRAASAVPVVLGRTKSCVGLRSRAGARPAGPRTKSALATRSCAYIGWIVAGLFDGLADCCNYASDRMN